MSTYEDFEDDDDMYMSWEDALEKAEENPKGEVTEGFIKACISYVQSVIRDMKHRGYLTNDEEFLPGNALDDLDRWETRMMESLHSYRNESMKYVIKQIDKWEEKLYKEFS